MTVTFGNPTFSSDYQALCNTIADTLNRADLLTNIPNFVSLATERIQRDMTNMGHPGALTLISYTGGTTLQAAYTNLPADFGSAYQLLCSNRTLPLEQITPDQAKQIQSQGWPPQDVTPIMPPYTPPSTHPTYFTIIGNQLLVIPNPTPTATLDVDMYYYAQVSGLDATHTTNWVLTAHPDLYLYGALLHSAPFLKADERVQLWEAMYVNVREDIRLSIDRSKSTQSKLVSARKSF
jgi:hypothetical protein